MSDQRNVSDSIANALRDKGLPTGCVLMVHSGMGTTASMLRGAVNSTRNLREHTHAAFATALRSVVGSKGTLCVPGFFYQYARHGTPFDARTSPPDKGLGTFPGYFHTHLMTHRSLCPTVSIMTQGPEAETIASVPSLWGNGLFSPWTRLVEADAWVLFWGATAESMTFVHHVEALATLPHLFNKVYRVPVRDMNDREYLGCFNAVRYLDNRFGVKYSLSRFVRDISMKGLLIEENWRGVEFSLARFRTIQEHLLEHLRDNPFYLLEKPPTFVRGVLPDDGPERDLKGL